MSVPRRVGYDVERLQRQLLLVHSWMHRVVGKTFLPLLKGFNARAKIVCELNRQGMVTRSDVKRTFVRSRLFDRRRLVIYVFDMIKPTLRLLLVVFALSWFPANAGAA